LKTPRTGSRRALESSRPAPKVRPQRSGPLHIELIAVGRDLLRGHVGDTNSSAIAEFFSGSGALVHRITVVDDNERVVADALREALDRNPHIVVTTGGLGPAPDDVTLPGVSQTLGQPLSVNQQAREMVEAAYQRLAKKKKVRSAGMTLAREKMCKLPVGSTAVPNEHGIAPGVLCKLPGGSAVICLPGLPDEALAVLQTALSLLHELVPRGHTARREVEAPLADESALRALLEQLTREFPGLWISSRPVKPGQQGLSVLVTLEATASTEDEAESALAGALRRLLAIAGGSK
jgi:molybdenum cofactor synthesis domain-containing protein